MTCKIKELLIFVLQNSPSAEQIVSDLIYKRMDAFDDPNARPRSLQQAKAERAIERKIRISCIIEILSDISFGGRDKLIKNLLMKSLLGLKISWQNPVHPKDLENPFDLEDEVNSKDLEDPALLGQSQDRPASTLEDFDFGFTALHLMNALLEQFADELL